MFPKTLAFTRQFRYIPYMSALATPSVYRQFATIFGSRHFHLSLLLLRNTKMVLYAMFRIDFFKILVSEFLINPRSGISNSCILMSSAI